ncbi:MAG: NAD-dependent epimerase/dehydratase family protein [Alistipes ihumii]
MDKLNILLTGANGYIGRHIVSRLVELGHAVTACDLTFTDKHPEVKYVEYNILQKHPDDLFSKLGAPDVCLHMAWRDGFVHNSDRHMQDLSAHFDFLKTLIDGGLKRLAVMGTMHEIGYWEGAIDEHTPCNPVSLYGIAKDALRRSMMWYCGAHDCQLQWLRAYYILGDDAKNHSVFSKILQAAEAGDQTFPFTTGKSQYDFIDVGELADQIACAVSQNEILGIINCCTGRPVSLAEKAERFIAERGLNIRLAYGAYPDRPYDSPVVYGDPAKIRKIMGIINH